MDTLWRGLLLLLVGPVILVVALCLVAKPMVDECLLRRLGTAARRNGDTLLGLLTDAQLRDSDRSRRWAISLTKFLLAEPGNAELMRGWLDKWTQLAEKAARSYCGALPDGAEHAAAAIAAVADVALVCGLAS